jgi:hypothetical protein
MQGVVRPLGEVTIREFLLGDQVTGGLWGTSRGGQHHRCKRQQMQGGDSSTPAIGCQENKTLGASGIISQLDSWRKHAI